MNKKMLNVMITSAGTASAVNVIKSLRKQNEFDINIIAIDNDPLASGLRLADKHYIVPLVSDSKYITTILDIASFESIEIMLPIYSGEIAMIAENKKILESNNIKTLLPDSDVIKLCNDKPAMTEFVRKLGINTPKIYSNEEIRILKGDEFPLFIKPVTGSSSSGALKIEDNAELEFHLRKNKDILVQDFIEGQEVTIDCFCNKQSEALVVAPRLRLAIKSGQSVKGKTIDNKKYFEIVKNISKKLGMVGVCNLQFIERGNDLFFIEINPRYAAGGLMLTVESGANIPLLVIKEILDLPILKEECSCKTNVFMSRYWEEVFWKEN